ncbi:MAG: hypothetical protein F4X98_11010 [Gammaproteobacteria bacterium]|nr:hypothetical protein [Gammaproteobacteria bacterium]
MDLEPLFPHIEVVLVVEDGNAFNIIGTVRQALRQHGVEETRVVEFTEEATSADYDNVIRTAMRWVQVV